MLKYLRIVVTVMGLTACVLLIALWVRSYGAADSLSYGGGPYVAALDSIDGRLYLSGSASGGANLQPYLPNRQRRGPTQTLLWESVRAAENALGFGTLQDLWLINTSTLIVPHWFPVLLFATLAVAPWIAWFRRFSLRTLLIATTLVAVGLGIIAASM